MKIRTKLVLASIIPTILIAGVFVGLLSKLQSDNLNLLLDTNLSMYQKIWDGILDSERQRLKLLADTTRRKDLNQALKTGDKNT
jgi:hypothetical protein